MFTGCAYVFCKFSYEPRKYFCRSQWRHGLRLLRLLVRIPPEPWMFVCCDCCVLSSRDLCDSLIIGPEESYGLRCVVVCDLETLWMRRPWPTGGCRAKNKKTNKIIFRINCCGCRNGLRCGRQLRIYWISSRGQLARGGPPAWGLGEELTTLPCKTARLRNTHI